LINANVEHNSFEDAPWTLRLVDFTKKVLEQDRVRIVGVCFGHQIVGRALGLPVGRSDKGWEISVVPVQLTEMGKDIFQSPNLVSDLLFRT
jgi:GMP synthase-like glutamine amidotransferase